MRAPTRLGSHFWSWWQAPFSKAGATTGSPEESPGLGEGAHGAEGGHYPLKRAPLPIHVPPADTLPHTKGSAYVKMTNFSKVRGSLLPPRASSQELGLGVGAMVSEPRGPPPHNAAKAPAKSRKIRKKAKNPRRPPIGAPRNRPPTPHRGPV